MEIHKPLPRLLSVEAARTITQNELFLELPVVEELATEVQAGVLLPGVCRAGAVKQPRGHQ